MVMVPSGAKELGGHGAPTQGVIDDTDEDVTAMREGRGALKQASDLHSAVEQVSGLNAVVGEKVPMARVVKRMSRAALNVSDASGVVGGHQASDMVTKAFKIVRDKEIAKRSQESDDRGRRRGRGAHEVLGFGFLCGNITLSARHLMYTPTSLF